MKAVLTCIHQVSKRLPRRTTCNCKRQCDPIESHVYAGTLWLHASSSMLAFLAIVCDFGAVLPCFPVNP